MSRSTIIPHSSHVMGDVDGERACTVCYAAPWMAISEDPCPIGDVRSAGIGLSRAWVTAEELAEVVRLRAEGIEWTEIGARMNRRPETLKRAARKARAAE